MNKAALIISLVLASHMAQAQQASQPTGLDAERNLAEIGNTSNATMVRTYDNRYEGVKGTPFLNEEWSKATITINNKLVKNVDVKYNAYEGELLYRNAEGQEFVLAPFKVDSFVLKDNKTNEEYTFKKFPVLASQDSKLAQRFAAALYEGKELQLVMVPQKNMIKADFKGPYSSGNKYDEIQTEQVYYLLGPDNAVSKVKLNKKNLLKALPDNRDKLQSYINSERLDANTAADWVKALAYYESL